MTTKPTLETDRVTGAVVTATEWNTNVLQNGRYLQEVVGGTNADKVPAAALGTDVTLPNLLVNGGFEVWQRGTGSYTSSGGRTADWWQLNLTSGATTVTASSTTDSVNPSQFSVQAVVTSGSSNILQSIEHATELQGRVLSVSARVQGSVAACNILLRDYNGTTNDDARSSAVTADGAWHTLTISKTIRSGAQNVYVAFEFNNPGTFYVDNVMAVVGPNPVTYVPTIFSTEIYRCRRSWTKLSHSARWASLTAGSFFEVTLNYPVTMPVTPTVTITGGTHSNTTSTNALTVGLSSLRIETTATAGTASTGTDTYSVDDTVIIEANVA